MKRPMITVMTQARTPERILELMEKGIAGGADAFGIQVEQLAREYRTEAVFQEIFAKAGGRPVYVTNYRNNENTGRTEEALAEELLQIADWGGDIFDVCGDMFCPVAEQITYDKEAIEKQKQLISALKAKGKKVLMSSHTGLVMSYEDIYGMICEQKSRGADIAKIVSVSKTAEDESECLETSSRLAKEHISDFLFLTSGEFCRTHRRVAPLIVGGFFLCVAEHDALATAAQPLLCDVKTIVDTVCPEA